MFGLRPWAHCDTDTAALGAAGAASTLADPGAALTVAGSAASREEPIFHHPFNFTTHAAAAGSAGGSNLLRTSGGSVSWAAGDRLQQGFLRWGALPWRPTSPPAAAGEPQGCTAAGLGTLHRAGEATGDWTSAAIGTANRPAALSNHGEAADGTGSFDLGRGGVGVNFFDLLDLIFRGIGVQGTQLAPQAVVQLNSSADEASLVARGAATGGDRYASASTGFPLQA